MPIGPLSAFDAETSPEAIFLNPLILSVMTVTQTGQIGFFPELLIKVSHQDYGILEAAGLGTSRAFSVITDNIRGFKKIASGDVSASKALSGPIGIAQMFGGVWDWTRFWMLTGLLSMALAFMNILPIPALDGGQLLRCFKIPKI